MQNNIVIVAGGSGSRMGAEVPKQFLVVAGLPILMHTLANMNKALPNATISLVLPQTQIDHWNKLVRKYNFQVQHTVVIGGSSRTESVKNGLKSINNVDGVVGIHDGVRPCFSTKMVQRCFAVAAEKGNAIPVVPVIPSLRRMVQGKSVAANRDEYRAVQTPQCFRLKELKNAYTNSDSNHSDDASLMESFGHEIHLVEGNQNNIKITYPLDVQLAEFLLGGSTK